LTCVTQHLPSVCPTVGSSLQITQIKKKKTYKLTISVAIAWWSSIFWFQCLFKTVVRNTTTSQNTFWNYADHRSLE